MCSIGYMRMVAERNEYIELLPVGPAYSHAKSECRAVCYSDVVVRREKAYANLFYMLTRISLGRVHTSGQVQQSR